MASSNYTVVDERNFIHATRSTGYRSTAAAIAELIDNAIQAKAKKIQILIVERDTKEGSVVEVFVLDNGHGMDSKTLRNALRFGGSSRFDDRSGQGRFGMGLPNASVSQTPCVEVYTWQSPGKVISSHIDVDEISSGRMAQVPVPRRKRLPDIGLRMPKRSGTLIAWRRCDQLDNRRVNTVARKLHNPLGRQFRFFLWKGIEITINGQPVLPIDPLFIGQGRKAGAKPFGEVLEYELRIPNNPEKTSIIEIRFTELPVAKWHDLPVEEKRKRGISKGAGASIVRADREVDYGWFFFGDKRKENYDDWWRCEIRYQPELDEYFGITHNKQAINPTQDLKEILSQDLGAVAHALNSRVRQAYLVARGVPSNPSQAARRASKQEAYLPPIKLHKTTTPNGSKRASEKNRNGKTISYRLTVERLKSPEFFMHTRDRNGNIAVTVNKNHAFYQTLYSDLAKLESPEALRNLEYLLLSAARAAIATESDGLKPFHTAWSKTLETFLNE